MVAELKKKLKTAQACVAREQFSARVVLWTDISSITVVYDRK